MSPYASSRRLRLACLALTLGATGCAGLNDPFEREGTWRPENVNNANIEAMVARPHDLVMGVNDDVSPGILSAEAVHRLLTDHVKPLPVTQIGPVQATAQSSGGGVAPGAAP